jgi:hypothetical protein
MVKTGTRDLREGDTGGMRRRPVGFLLTFALVLAGCAPDGPAGENAVPFTEVELPAEVKPIVLTPVGDLLLTGVRRDGVPGLLSLGPDGVLTNSFEEIPVHPNLYGQRAYWYSLVTDDRRVMGIGGKTGGAHGNVRWSVWEGSTAELVEKPQPITTFGGYGGGALVDMVLTPSGPAIVGTWQSATVGLDIMVWRPDGKYWARQPVAGTALENQRDSLKFPLAATALGEGALIVGWELSDGRQRPAVWRAKSGVTDWTMTRLPDAGRSGALVSVRCAAASCTAAGWVDGKLAMWTLTGEQWTRVRGVPPVAVAQDDDLAAPVTVSGKPAVIVDDGDRVVLARAGSPTRPLSGPSGTVAAVAQVGDTVFVAAGDKLWWADLVA